jgi:hypothetical protein
LEKGFGCLYADFGMAELDEMWTNALREAMNTAQNTGRSDVMDYLRLRETNDAARRVGIEWLTGTFLEVVDAANKRGANLAVEKSEAHKFPVGAATMQGVKIRFSYGIRSLTVEAGFPRLPQDGFIRGGGLACARITHFGVATANSELMLFKSDKEKEAPVWFAISADNFRQPFTNNDLKNHFAVFLAI